MPITPEQFKRGMGQFVTGVTVVSTACNGQYYGITVNSFNSVSLDPPLILFSIEKRAYLYPLLCKSPFFTVNILEHSQQPVSEHFAFGKQDDWSHIPYLIGENGCPALKHASAALECKAHQVYDGGDHSIIVGEVTAVYSFNPEAQPLAYYQGKYTGITG